jgi:hypothetical protein
VWRAGDPCAGAARALNLARVSIGEVTKGAEYVSGGEHLSHSADKNILVQKSSCGISPRVLYGHTAGGQLFSDRPWAITGRDIIAVRRPESCEGGFSRKGHERYFLWCFL